MNKLLPFSLLFPALMVLLALSGCSIHTPQTVHPPGGMPQTFAAEELFQEQPAQPHTDQWWQAFEDERLDALVRELFTGNLELEGARARLERALAAVDVAEAAHRPVVGLEATGGRQRQSTLIGPQTADRYRLSAAAAFEIDLWGKLEARKQAAVEDSLALADDLNAMQVSLSATLADLYYLAMEAGAQVDLVDQAAAHATNSLELTRRRYREGLVPLLDVHQARQNLARIKAQRPTHEARLAQARNALAVLLGRYPGNEGGEQPPAALPSPPDVFAAGLPARLLTHRPDIRAAQRRLQAADARIAAAVADRFPSFSLNAAYGGASTDLTNLLSPGNILWSVLLNAAQPLLDGGRREAQVRISRAEFEELLARYHQTVLQAFAEVETALTNNEATARRIALLEDQHVAVERTLATAMWRYRHGLNDYLPVLQAQTALVDTEAALLSARRQVLADRVQLARALGGGF